MSNRFEDNVTPLDAATLNKFESDVRKAGLPIYNAVYEAGSGSSFRNYRISDQQFENELKVGYVFIMVPDISSQGTSNEIIAIRHGNLGDPLYWNDSDKPHRIGYDYARVNSTKYLEAGRPYIVKCFTKVYDNYQFIITEIYKDKIAGQTEFGCVKAWISGTTLNISTN